MRVHIHGFITVFASIAAVILVIAFALLGILSFCNDMKIETAVLMVFALAADVLIILLSKNIVFESLLCTCLLSEDKAAVKMLWITLYTIYYTECVDVGSGYYIYTSRTGEALFAPRYIYLSTEFIKSEKPGKINTVNIGKTFIKFHYTEKAFKYLSTKLPKKQLSMLQYNKL